jgi:outer membrane immunogenic protein
MRTKFGFARSSVAALGIAAFAATPVLAADVVYEEPPAPMPPIEAAPMSNWSGPYAGIHLGYGFGGRVTEPGNRIGTDGFTGGGFGGFNFQDGQFVYGVEGDVNYSNLRGSNAGTRTRTTIDGSLRARAGIAATDNILVYGTAGVAAERLRVSAAGDSETNPMLGYTVGAGVDAKLTDQVFGRVEYRFTDYARKDFDIAGADRRIDSRNHRVTVGLGIKF